MSKRREVSDDDAESPTASLSKRGARLDWKTLLQTDSNRAREQAAAQTAAANALEASLVAGIARASKSVDTLVADSDRLLGLTHEFGRTTLGSARRHGRAQGKVINEAALSAHSVLSSMDAARRVLLSGARQQMFQNMRLATLEAPTLPGSSFMAPVVTLHELSFGTLRTSTPEIKIHSVGYGRISFQVLDSMTGAPIEAYSVRDVALRYRSKPVVVNSTLRSYFYNRCSFVDDRRASKDLLARHGHDLQVLNISFDDAAQLVTVHFYPVMQGSDRAALRWPEDLEAVCTHRSTGAVLSAVKVPPISDQMYERCMLLFSSKLAVTPPPLVTLVTFLTVFIGVCKPDSAAYSDTEVLEQMNMHHEQSEFRHDHHLILDSAQRVRTFMNNLHTFHRYPRQCNVKNTDGPCPVTERDWITSLFTAAPLQLEALLQLYDEKGVVPGEYFKIDFINKLCAPDFTEVPVLRVNFYDVTEHVHTTAVNEELYALLVEFYKDALNVHF